MKSTRTVRFTAADQQRFARLSGDSNPVHLDAVAARRILAGEPIVHGMHLLLRMLEAHISTGARGRSRTRALQRLKISATFQRPAIVGERIRFARDADGRLSADADGGTTLAVATLTPGEGAATHASPPPRMRLDKRRRTPAVRSAAEADGARGVVALPSASALGRAFPRAARALGADVVAALAGVSTLVGMECPGRDSLLSAVRIEVTPHERPDRLAWSVQRVDRRFGLVRIDVHGAGVEGSVDTFLRPLPAPLPTLAAAAAHAGPCEFAGVRALIVGGSRGLGAATAMLIAAGGGLPIVTYASGAGEAAILQRDAARARRRIEALRLDVGDADAARIVAGAAARFEVTQLYYFATPRIFVRRSAPFDVRLFDRFAAFYVSGFARVAAAAVAASPSLAVFYPSSTAIDEAAADLTEYAAAKAAGECICRAMAEEHADARIVVRRLPRIATDQTASILPAPALDPFDAMLPILRQMQTPTRGSDR